VIYFLTIVNSDTVLKGSLKKKLNSAPSI